MNTCPHCRSTPCIPAWRKLSLGPVATTTCRTCGYRVGVDPIKAWVAMLPTLILVVVAAGRIVRDPISLIVGLVVCLGATCALYLQWVPIKPDELTNARMVAEGRARIAGDKGRGIDRAP